MGLSALVVAMEIGRRWDCHYGREGRVIGGTCHVCHAKSYSQKMLKCGDFYPIWGGWVGRGRVTVGGLYSYLALPGTI